MTSAFLIVRGNVLNMRRDMRRCMRRCMRRYMHDNAYSCRIGG